MANITVFGGSSAVPAFAQKAIISNLEAVKIGGGYPVISLKGKVFTFRDGEESRLITEPDDPAVPARSLELVILDIGPSSDRKINAKVWYAKAFEEGGNAKPDCYSNDGIEPAADSADKQANKCALCEKNVFVEGKGTACSSSKRLAVATADALDKPMLLRVPATSLAPLGEYLKWMKTAGIQHSAHIVTKVGFDYSVAHQKLTFKGLGWAQSDPTEFISTDTVAYITGKKEMPKAEVVHEEPFETPKPTFAEPKAEAAKPAAKKEKPAPAPKADDEDDLPTTPKVKTEIKVEEPAKPAVKTEPVVAADAALEAALDDLDFDDM